MTVSEHVWIGGGGLRGGGVGGSYQPGVYVPLKALFLVGNQFIVSTIKFREGFSKFMIPIALLEKFCR